jgi:hypothetical protein
MTWEELRTRAQECDDLAKQTRDSTVKRSYEELARQWRELAVQVESRQK